MQTFSARLCVVAFALGAAVSAVGSDAAAPAFVSASLPGAIADCLDTSSGKDASGLDCFLQGDGVTECSTAGADCYFISDWDVSGVTSMANLFSGATSFNQDIGNWDVSSVTNMYRMFIHAQAFNQDIGNWDVGSVTTMAFMFQESQQFNQPIGNWDVSSVENMEAMFYGASAFNQDISRWDVSSVGQMGQMFKNAVSFDANILDWKTTAITEKFDDTPTGDNGKRRAIENMFLGATAWLAKYRRIPVMSLSDYDEYDVDYDLDRHDFDTFGPPSAWILRPEEYANGSGGSNGSDGLSGSSGSDFPEWGIALAGVALALSAVTSVFVLIQKLCCSGPKYHPGLTCAMQDQPQPQRVIVANQV